MATNLYGKSCTPNTGGVLDFYTKAEVNALLASRAGTSTTYTRAYIDGRLSTLEDSISSLSASAIDQTNLDASLTSLQIEIEGDVESTYATLANTYTKAEVDGLISGLDLDPDTLLRKVPTDTATNTIDPGANNATPLTLKGSSTNAVVQRWLDNSGDVIGYVSNDGTTTLEGPLTLGRLVSDGSAALDVSGKRITNLADPDSDLDAVHLGYLKTYVLDFYKEASNQGSTQISSLDAGTYSVVSILRDSYRHLRSSVTSKRPLASDLLDGELAVNYNSSTPGIFLRDNLGKVRKAGPAHKGSVAPSPTNNTLLSDGELWIDESGPAIRYYDEALEEWIGAGTDRSTHTGTQEINTINGLADALASKEEAGAAAALLEKFKDSRKLYVSLDGDDSNDGTSMAEPLRTIRAASLIAEPGDIVFIAPGTYVETSLPIRWKYDVSVFGSSLRNTIVQPAPGQEFNDIFKVDSGFWCWGISFAGHQADETRQAWAVDFDELADNTGRGALGLGAFILKSPYIQNCTSITAEDDSGLAGSQSTGNTGGGISVDGDKCSINSPIRSMVVDSYTQVNLGGPGCLVKNDGYAQLVSFFGTFCTYHVRTETGGQVNLSGGGTTDFGTYGLMADGYSTRPLFTGQARSEAYGALRSEKIFTVNLSTNLFSSQDHKLILNDQVTFRATAGTLPTGLQQNITYYVISEGLTASTFKVSEALGGTPVDLSGVNDGTYLFLRQGVTEVDIIDFTANRLGRKIKYPTAGSLGSAGNPVLVTSRESNTSGAVFTVTLGTSTIGHEYIGGGTITVNGTTTYPVSSSAYEGDTGVTSLSATGYTPVLGDSIVLSGLTFICNSSSRPNAGQLMFPQLVFPRNAVTEEAETKTFPYTRTGNYTLTYTELASPNGPEHEYVTGGTIVIGGIDYGVENAIYNKDTGLVTITTTTQLPAGDGNVTVSGLQFICPSSAYIVTGSIPIDSNGNEVSNDSLSRAGYRVIFYSGLNGGLSNTIRLGQVIDFRSRSQISAPSHTFEYVGSGTNYDALPWNGGISIPENAIVETNNGKVYSSNTNEKGDFSVGSQFKVDGSTGSVTINTDQFNLSGLNFIGPFSRNGGISSVGVQLREISNNLALISSLGAPDVNTVPTQVAVKTYVDDKFLTDITASSGSALSVSDTSTQDSQGYWTRTRNISITTGAEPNTVASGDDERFGQVFVSATNTTASTIFKGRAVSFSGSGENVIIKPTVSDGSETVYEFLGITSEDIVAGGRGKVIISGELSGLNTNAFEEGDVLWCNPASPGTFTRVKPISPNLKIGAAVVLSKDAENGVLMVNRSLGQGGVDRLQDLIDVDVTTTIPNDGEALVWDDAAGEWVPGAAGASAAGSANQIQYNDGSSDLAASADLTWDDTAKELGVGGDINLDDGGTFTTTLQMVTPTQDRVISFPNATGTVGLVAGSSGNLVFNSAGDYAGVSGSVVDSSGNITISGRFTNSANGIASNPPVSLNGTWFSGGTPTTTKPQFLIEPTGVTSTGWSTNGTGLGVNTASGFSGNIFDAQVNGTSVFRIDSSGDVSVPLGSNTAPSIYFGSDTRTGVYSPGPETVAISTNGTQRILIEDDGDINIDSGGVFYDATNNRLAIGVTGPGDKLEIGGNGAGIILASPDGTRYRITVANGGTLSVVAV